MGFIIACIFVLALCALARLIGEVPAILTAIGVAYVMVEHFDGVPL